MQSHTSSVLRLRVSSEVLVIGGAGYVGSHTALALTEAGFDVTVFDDLSTGHSDFVRTDLTVASILDREALRSVFTHHSFSAVLHFAAKAYVGESVIDPAEYYITNVVGTLNVLTVMHEFGVNNIVFSSTCATYGVPNVLPITEDALQHPINPYGRTKLTAEWAIKDYVRAYGGNYTILRYFNVAGADPTLRIGERHNPETHLIPLIIDAGLGIRDSISVYGTDYPTSDGTCIRDYIHVSDLADAHVAAMIRMKREAVDQEFNVGVGNGYSVLEVIRAVEQVSGSRISIKEEPRRDGDPPELVSNATRIRELTGWCPRFGSIEDIVKTAWAWHKKEYE